MKNTSIPTRYSVVRVGKQLEYDAANMKVTNCPEADQFINPAYRPGWTL